MRIFITASCNYAVMDDEGVIPAMFSSLKQAMAFISLHGRKSIFTWENFNG